MIIIEEFGQNVIAPSIKGSGVLLVLEVRDAVNANGGIANW
jgi:hypothetical protein